MKEGLEVCLLAWKEYEETVMDIRKGIVDTVKENKKQIRNVMLVRNVIAVKAGALNMQNRSSQGVMTCVMSSVYVIIVSWWFNRLIVVSS